MQFYIDTFADALPTIWAVITFRLAPFVAYAVASARVPGRGKMLALFAICVWLAGAWLRGTSGITLMTAQCVCFGYFGLCAFATWLVACRIHNWTGAAHWLLCFGLFALCVVLPKLGLPAPADAAAVPFGWEFSLAAYSYVREVRREHRQPALADGLFFLMVNPVLVYAERSRIASAPALGSRNCARVGLGVLALTFHCAVLALETSWANGTVGAPESHGAASAVRFIVQQALHFVAAYVLFSAIASLQVGSLRLLGCTVPERFSFPLAASSPADFWRRWNTYVGSWARRYLFFPITTSVRRRLKGRSSAGTVSVCAAAMATFMLVGLYHDVGAYVANGSVVIGCFVTFAVSGAILLIWSGMSRWLLSLPKETRALRAIFGLGSWSGVSRLSFLVLLVVNAWIASSTTSGASTLTVDVVVRWLRDVL